MTSVAIPATAASAATSAADAAFANQKIDSVESHSPLQAPAKFDYLTPRFDSMPAELKQHARWVAWAAESKGGAKPIKVPYDPNLPNSWASSVNPATWGAFEQAVTAFEEGGRTGIGFVLDGDGIVGIDIDNCVVNQVVSADALALLRDLNATYIEYSPSGTGLRAFGFAENLKAGANGTYNGMKVEVYSDARYLTLTGHVLQAAPLEPLRGFTELADALRSGTPASGSECHDRDQRGDQAAWVSGIVSGTVYHDSLRNLAASLIATGLQPGAAVNHLRGLMESSHGPRDERWQARMDAIPNLVDSATEKFSPTVADTSHLLQSLEAMQEGVTMSSRFKLRSGSDIAQVPPIKWTIRGLMPQEGLAALYGPSGAGKSFLALDMCAAIASGADEWYGMRVTQQSVTYCVLEGEGGMGKRVLAWEKHQGMPTPDALRFIVQPVDIMKIADVQELAIAIRQAHGTGGLIVLDTLNRAAPGADENASKDMGVIIANAKALQVLTGGMVLLVHHTGKDEAKGMRGHSSLFAAMDCVIGVMKTKADGLSWTISKSKDDETGKMHPFRLDQVVVAQDEDGEDITSCVAVSTTAPFALRGARKLGPHQTTARDVLRQLFADSPNAIPDVPYDTAVDAIGEALDVEPKRRRERAKAAIAALTNSGLVHLTESHVVWVKAFGPKPTRLH